MRSRGYYSFSDHTKDGLNKCSTESQKYPLVVNCAGDIFSNSPFITNNKSGRLDYYLLYVISGELDVVDGDEHTSLVQGHAVIFPPHYKYKYVYSGKDELHYAWVHFTGSQVESILEDIEVLPFPNIHHIGNDISLKHRFENIFDAYSNHDKYRDRDLGVLLERLLIEIARASNTETTAQTNIRKSLNYINSSYAEKINIPELAKMEHLSTSRYNYIFKRIMGVSPSRYIISLRMRSACDLLKNTDLSVKQISIMCGYDDTHFFSKVFSAYMGCPPTAYKKSL